MSTTVNPVVYDDLVSELARLHAPQATTTCATIEDGDVTDIEEDTFEEITSRETLCMTCHGYPQWPCFEAALLMQHGIEFEKTP